MHKYEVLPMMKSFRLALGFAGIAAVAAIAGPAGAQPYPSRPVTIITPFAAGSVTDATARAIAQHLQEALGQSFVVENRTGAGGLFAANAVAPRRRPYAAHHHQLTHAFGGA
jgi:tripartite-type tricarboxylate transporter receptor subunit TctC